MQIRKPDDESRLFKGLDIGGRGVQEAKSKKRFGTIIRRALGLDVDVGQGGKELFINRRSAERLLRENKFIDDPKRLTEKQLVGVFKILNAYDTMCKSGVSLSSVRSAIRREMVEKEYTKPGNITGKEIVRMSTDEWNTLLKAEGAKKFVTDAGPLYRNYQGWRPADKQTSSTDVYVDKVAGKGKDASTSEVRIPIGRAMIEEKESLNEAYSRAADAGGDEPAKFKEYVRLLRAELGELQKDPITLPLYEFRKQMLEEFCAECRIEESTRPKRKPTIKMLSDLLNFEQREIIDAGLREGKFMGTRVRDMVLATVNKNRDTPCKPEDIEIIAFGKFFNDDFASGVPTETRVSEMTVRFPPPDERPMRWTLQKLMASNSLLSNLVFREKMPVRWMRVLIWSAINKEVGYRHPLEDIKIGYGNTLLEDTDDITKILKTKGLVPEDIYVFVKPPQERTTILLEKFLGYERMGEVMNALFRREMTFAQLKEEVLSKVNEKRGQPCRSEDVKILYQGESLVNMPAQKILDEGNKIMVQYPSEKPRSSK